MWERFTYYGMRAHPDPLHGRRASGQGGPRASTMPPRARSTGCTWAAPTCWASAGGWIADRLLGAQRAVISGGLFIMVGNALLALGNTAVFFIGLLVIAIGVGLLKPNVSALVASLYPEGGSRRDAGFSIFYMGINLGAFLGSHRWCRVFAAELRLALGLCAAGARHGDSAWRSSCGRATTSARPGSRRRPSGAARGCPVIVILAAARRHGGAARVRLAQDQRGHAVGNGDLGVRAAGTGLLRLPHLLRRTHTRWSATARSSWWRCSAPR